MVSELDGLCSDAVQKWGGGGGSFLVVPREIL